MSASREKKVRQDVKGQELTEKQLQAQKEAAQAKRNSIIYTVLGVVATVAVVALLVWNSGFFQGKAAAVNIGGTEYSAADVQYHYNSVLNYYRSYAGLIYDFDVSVDPADQMYDEEAGITWHDQIMTEAIDYMAQSKAVAKLAKEEGFTLSEEGKHEVEHAMEDQEAAAITNGFTTTTAYLKAAFGNGMTKGKFKALQMEGMLVSEYIAKYNEELSYTDAELEKYYTENADEMDVFSYNYAVISGKPAEVKDQNGAVVEPTAEEKAAAMAAAKTIADDIVARIKSGGDFDSAVSAYEEDTRVSPRGQTSVSGASLQTVLADWLKDTAREDGDLTVIAAEDESNYYVVEYMGRARNVEVPANVRHILVAAMQNEGATEPTQLQYDAAKVKAEQLLNKWKSGAATEESFAELAKTESADYGSAANGGLYEGVSSASGFIAEFTDWALDPARQPGDTGLVKNTGSSTKGWHIMYYVGDDGEEVWRTSARIGLSTEATNAWLDQLVEEQNVERLAGLANVG